MALRNALYESIGASRTLAFLAHRFAGGTARNYIDDLRRGMSASAASDDSLTSIVIERLRPELIEYEKQAG
jgi:hypothetical protein